MTIHNGKFVAYFRVSTNRQGKSGLGLDAQRDRVLSYLNGGKWDMIGEYTEIESGRMKERPALASAIRLCKKEKATLVVARLDRLTRDFAFGAQLLDDKKVKFICADFPEASREMLQLRMVMAEWEARKISENTKEALGALKRKGVKLGSPTPMRGSVAGTKVIQEQADAFAERIRPLVQEAIKRSGAKTLREISAALADRGVETRRGNLEWSPTQVKNLMARIAK